MNPQQQERWDEACKMEERYPGNAYVLEQAIRIRNEILQEMEKKFDKPGTAS